MFWILSNNSVKTGKILNYNVACFSKDSQTWAKSYHHHSLIDSTVYQTLLAVLKIPW